VKCDIRSLSAAEQARDATLEAFGRVDLLVNNAGIAGPNMPTWKYPTNAWNEVIETNLNGTFHCCRVVIPSMIEQDYGRIVNIASIAGKEIQMPAHTRLRKPASSPSRRPWARSSPATT
jgi:NAD(P)-dependent dehydrogenase (short-subunit alcohol dehydrogenase family)